MHITIHVDGLDNPLFLLQKQGILHTN